MKKAIQFGAGNIGRGFIGALLSKSGYHVVFADVNEEIITKLHEQKEYTVYIKDENTYEETIKNISAVMSNKDDIYKELSDCDLITTAVGPLILPLIAPTIANGIKIRKDNKINKILNIIACENTIRATNLLKEEILKNLDKDCITYLNENVNFLDCSVDRIVPPIKTDNPIDIVVEEFFEWNIENVNIKGGDLNIEGANLVENLTPYIERKLFTLNTGHCITAYFGILKGYTYIHESIKDDYIRNIVIGAMQESSQALSIEHNFNINDLYNYINKIIKRFENKYLVDDLLRVAREPMRKLSKTDRLVNPMLKCYNKNIVPNNLYLGIACAFHFINIKDKQSVELQNLILKNGLEDTIQNICDIQNKDIINHIVLNYNKLI